jgi:hypothetical protein
MKPSIIIATVIIPGLVLGFSSCATRDGSRSVSVPVYQSPPAYAVSQAPLVTVDTPSDPGWPLSIVSGVTNVIVYQPRVDTWDGHLLTAFNAVAIQSPGQMRAVYGVITINAITLVDKAQRLVSLEDPKIVRAEFPSAPRQTDQYLRVLREKFPKEIKGLPLDELEASLTLTPQRFTGSGQPLNNTPPEIVFSTKPAILISIDGAPAYRSVPGTDLQRVINTRLLLVKDSTGEHYLRLSDHQYLKAPTLEGPWTVASQPPPGVLEAEKTSSTATPLDLPEAQASQPVSLTNSAVPIIYVNTKPTELITFDGEPSFVPILGTRLLYAANTTANVFKLLSDQRTYVLLAGRWFSAPALEGPWQFVPGGKLPSDFANIPDSSPKENVKASVPGTTQAAEALIANSIPQSSKVDRSTPMQPSRIDGPPQLRPIEGTPLYYVVNSGTPIIKVDDQSWYACQNGVWFAATSVDGPWTVATAVPAVIYTIPVNSPLHYLTYVRVYGAGPDGVYEGYTPGYLGTEVSPDGTVVYGTGYPYTPWIGDDWYGGPETWGLGWDPYWTPWDDWAFGFGFGWGCGFGRFGWWRCHPPRPGWGPYRHWPRSAGFAGAGGRSGGWVNTSGRLYARSGAVTGRAFAGNPSVLGRGRAYNSRTGTLVAGQRGDLPTSMNRSFRTAATGGGLWNNRALASPGSGVIWENRGALNGVHGFGVENSLPFGASRSADGFQNEAHAFSHGGNYLNSGNAGGSIAGRGGFSYGGEAFSFPHGGGGLSFSHGGGTGGFSRGGGGGGFSFGGGGGGHGGGGGGGHGGGGGGGHR